MLQLKGDALIQLFNAAAPIAVVAAGVLYMLWLIVSSEQRKQVRGRLTHPDPRHRAVVYLGIVTCWSIALLVIRSQPTIDRPPMIEVTNAPPRLLGGSYEWKWALRRKMKKGEKFRIEWAIGDGANVVEQPMSAQDRSYRMVIPEGTSGNLRLSVTLVNAEGEELLRTEPKTVPIYADAFDAVLATGVLRVGIHLDNNFQTFCYFTERQYAGLDIDLIRRFATYLQRKHRLPQLEVRYELMSWQDLLKEIPNRSGPRIDLAIASISITRERKARLQFKFSTPYASTQMAAVFRRKAWSELSNPPREELDIQALKRFLIGVHAETTNAAFVGHHLGNGSLKTAASNPELFRWLADGAVKVVVYDYARALGEVAANHKANPGNREAQWVVRRIRPTDPSIESTADEKMIPTGREDYGIATSAHGIRLRDEFNLFLADPATAHFGGTAPGTVKDELFARLRHRLREIARDLLDDPDQDLPQEKG